MLLIVVITLITLSIGRFVVNFWWKGVFIDQRNRVSLARFQAIIWTILVLATFGETALANIALNAANPPVYVVTIPSNLWLVVGITVGALPAASIASSRKSKASADVIAQAVAARGVKDQEPILVNSEELDVTNIEQQNGVEQQIDCENISDALKIAMDADLGTILSGVKVTGKPEVNLLRINKNLFVAKGLIVARLKSKCAKFIDMFMGDEITNVCYIDIAKLQLFLFNVVIIIVFAVAIGGFFYSPPPYTLPNIPAVWAIFLAISNGAYVTFKAAPRTA